MSDERWSGLVEQIISGRPQAATSSRQAIADLISLYAWLIDTGDFAGIGRLFRSARVYGGGADPVIGGVAIAQSYRDLLLTYADGTPRTRHVVSGVLIAVDEDAGAAVARSSFLALQQTEDLALQPVAAGRYDDRFIREDGAWRFDERRITTELTGELGHHLRL